jgi:hypothetical protein
VPKFPGMDPNYNPPIPKARPGGPWVIS